MAVRVGTTSWTDKTLIDCKRFYPTLANNPLGALAVQPSLDFGGEELPS